MSDVVADVEALQAFIEGSERSVARLIDHRDRLAGQRLRLTTGRTQPVAQPSIGHLDRLIDEWTTTAASVGEVRADLLTADRSWFFEGGSPRGRVGPMLERAWTALDVDRLVELGALRTSLRRLAETGAASGRRAAGRLLIVEREMAALAATMDRDGWNQVAYRRAGVDPDWDPDDDLVDNDANVRGVYQFYGELYLENPDLLWAGMAGLVGRQLYAGWQDLYTARHLIDEGSRTKYLLELAGIPTGPDTVYDIVNIAADLSGGGAGVLAPVQAVASADLEWLEHKMLAMGKEIFEDMGWLHIAYHYGGVEAVEAAAPAAHRWDVRAMFRMIDSGDPTQVWQATQGMIVREQRDTIQDDWDEIRGRHGPIGEAITEFLTWTADNPIPGGLPYREVLSEPTGVYVPVADLPEFNDLEDLGHPWITLDYQEIQRPVGNLADYADRKAWIDRDIGPAFRRLATNEPERLASILRSPFDNAVDDQRLHPLPYPGGR